MKKIIVESYWSSEDPETGKTVQQGVLAGRMEWNQPETLAECATDAGSEKEVVKLYVDQKLIRLRQSLKSKDPKKAIAAENTRKLEAHAAMDPEFKKLLEAKGFKFTK